MYNTISDVLFDGDGDGVTIVFVLTGLGHEKRITQSNMNKAVHMSKFVLAICCCYEIIHLRFINNSSYK